MYIKTDFEFQWRYLTQLQRFFGIIKVIEVLLGLYRPRFDFRATYAYIIIINIIVVVVVAKMQTCWHI
jgi:hypothetical protein